MTGEEIIAIFSTMIDDSPDDDFVLFLLNSAKNEVEAGRDWNFNRGFDNTKTTAAGDNYLSMKDLPSDFLAPRRLFVQNDITPYIIIPFELRERYKDTYKRFYIDYVNKQFALCGTNGTPRVINMFYGRSTPDLTLSTSPVWPTVFHSYLPFKMAEIWGSSADADEVNFRMSAQQLRQANAILKQFIQWDARIKVAEYNGQNERNVNLASYPDVVGDNFIPS